MNEPKGDRILHPEKKGGGEGEEEGMQESQKGSVLLEALSSIATPLGTKYFCHLGEKSH